MAKGTNRGCNIYGSEQLFDLSKETIAFMTEGTSKEEEEVIVAQWRIVWLTFKCYVPLLRYC